MKRRPLRGVRPKREGFADCDFMQNGVTKGGSQLSVFEKVKLKLSGSNLILPS